LIISHVHIINKRKAPSKGTREEKKKEPKSKQKTTLKNIEHTNEEPYKKITQNLGLKFTTNSSISSFCIVK